MGLRITQGKKHRLSALTDERGVIAALAIDRRSTLRKLFAKARNVVPEGVTCRKADTVQGGCQPHPHSLCKCNPSRPRIWPARGGAESQKTTSLLLAYEETGYDKKLLGQTSRIVGSLDGGAIAGCGGECCQNLALLFEYKFARNE